VSVLIGGTNTQSHVRQPKEAKTSSEE